MRIMKGREIRKGEKPPPISTTPLSSLFCFDFLFGSTPSLSLVFHFEGKAKTSCTIITAFCCCQINGRIRMMPLMWCSVPPSPPPEAVVGTLMAKKDGSFRSVVMNMRGAGTNNGFPPFLPKEVEKIKDPYARTLAQRMERLPVPIGLSESCIMSSCVRPLKQIEINPVVLLHCFDSSCLEWRCAYPLLEEAGLEAWAVDVLGWGFSDLERCPPCSAASKRHHLYQFWKSYIRRPMVLVGPSLGGSVAIDFACHYPAAVEKLVLINASVYAEGTGDMAKLPKAAAYAGVSLLKSTPLRFYANMLAFNGISLATTFDWTNVGRLHCLLPWWEDATVSFMTSGGYNVVSQIKQVKQKVLVICSERDNIISYKQILRLRCELPSAIMRLIPDSGHLPHVDNPASVAKLIAGFARNGRC